MRFVSVALLIAAPLLAQEAEPEKLAFRFSCRQGWDLACVVGDPLTRDVLARLPVFTADQLLEGVPNPRVTGPGLDGMSAYERSAWNLDETRRRWSRDVSRDPIQLDGRAVLSRLGVPRIQLDSIKYCNMTLRWSIAFEDGGDVRADVGGPSRTIARRSWAQELARVQGAYRTALVKMGTPQVAEKRSEERRNGDGPAGGTPDPIKDATDHSPVPAIRSAPEASKSGGDAALKAMEPLLRQAGTSVALGAAKADRLYHFCALEEQYVALVLAEIQGCYLDEAFWMDAAKRHGTRIASQARQAVDRLVRHARGTLAPGAKKVVAAKWDGSIPAVPSFAWAAQGVAEREAMVRRARGRLTDLSETSQTQPMPQRDWESALMQELRRINELVRLHAPAESNATLEDIRWPIVFDAGTGTYSYTQQPMKGSAAGPGAIDIGSQGNAKGVTVFFFDSGLNRYVPSSVEYRTWYKGWVTPENR